MRTPGRPRLLHRAHPKFGWPQGCTRCAIRPGTGLASVVIDRLRLTALDSSAVESSAGHDQGVRVHELAKPIQDFDKVARRRRSGMLVALSLAFALVQLDAAIVNVA